MPGLAGKVCLVTGATGIAAESASRFASEGALVFVVSEHEADCRTLADTVQAGGGTCRYAVADLTDESQAVAGFGRCRDTFGRLDGVFAVAGGSGRRFGDGPVHELTLDAWERTVRLNAATAFLTAREGVRALLDNPVGDSGSRGSLLLMSSILATDPAPRHFATHAYAAAKGAVAALTRAMAAYYAPHHIRVNALAPAVVATPMSQRAGSDPETAADIARRQPLAGGPMPASDIAAAAAYLLSDAARYVTGQSVRIDAGWSVADIADVS